MSRVFISHSSANNAHALALAAWLDARGWSDYFLDIDDSRGIAPGERWMAALAGAVDRCEAVIFLLSPQWRDSKYCFTEFFEAKKLGKRIFGVIVDPLPLSQLPEQMTAEWQVCDLTDISNGVSFTVERQPSVPQTIVRFSAAGLDALAAGLRKAGLEASTFPWPPEGEPDRSPYPGLRSLDEVDAAVFFGREASIVRAIDQVRLVRERDVEQLFAILGASGAGKSSFLRAGLLPRLRRDSDHFVVLPPIRPERAAISGSQGLLASLKAALASAGRSDSAADIRLALASDGLAAVLSRVVPSGGRNVEPTVIVPIDQAEELFSSDGEAESQQLLAWLDQLRPNTGARSLRCLIVLTIRSDSLPSLQAHPVLQHLSPVLFSLPVMPASEFKSVIEGPARRHTEAVTPLIIAPQLTEQLVVDAHGADALPLLALTLEWLYREFTNAQGTRVGLEEYQRLGGVRGVIGIAVERAFARPSSEPAIPAQKDEQERLLWQLFPYIATVDPDTSDWKRRVALRGAIRRDLPQCDALATRLIEQRLLVADSRTVGEGADPVDVIEVAHEALLRQWDTMERWLRELGAALSASESIRRAANDWLRSGKDAALLVHTAHRLDAAEALLGDGRLQGRFEPIDAEYLAACRQRDRRELEEREHQLNRIAEQQRARARLQRRVTVGLSAAFVIVLAMTIWIVRQAREVGIQTSLVLIAAGQAAADQQMYDRSIRLSVLADRAAWLGGVDPAETFGQALRAVHASTLVTQLGDVPSRNVDSRGITIVNFSPDGTRVVTGFSGTATVWNVDTGERVGQPLRLEGDVTTVAFSPDGDRLVTVAGNSTRVWNASTGTAIGEAMPGGAAYTTYTASFSPDGTRVLTASGEARVWDAATGRPLGSPIGSDIRFAQFSPDGRRILTTTAYTGEARIWDVATGKPLVEPMRHDLGVAAAFSPDGTRVATVAHDNTARVWDASSGKAIGQPMLQTEPAAVTNELDTRDLSISFSPDGTRIVTAGLDNDARVWDVVVGKPLGRPMTHEAVVVSAVFSPDGTEVLTASADHSARLWNASSGDPIGDRRMHDGGVNAAVFSRDGSQVATASEDETARVWSVKARQPDERQLKPGEVTVSSIFNGGGKRVVRVNPNPPSRLWPLGSRQAFWSWLGGTLWVEELCQTSLRGRLAVITKEDVRAARILTRDRVDENICEGVWTEPRE